MMRAAKKFLIAVLAVALGAASLGSSSRAGTPTAQEQANMKLVADFYAALEQDYLHGNHKVRIIAEQYLSPGYIQHMEAARAFGPGREGYIHMFEQMPAVPPPAPGVKHLPLKVLALIAQGDLVVRINSRSAGANDQDPIYIFNMFRVQDGKLAEHWDGYSRPFDTQKTTGTTGTANGGK